jgi:minor capsid protein
MGTPADDMATKIQAIGQGTVGTSIFVGDELPVSAAVPENCVFVRPGVSPPSEDTFKRLHGMARFGVQVQVRGPRLDFLTAYTKARAIRSGCHGSPPSGYQDCKALASDPLYLGKDSQDRPSFTINFHLAQSF